MASWVAIALHAQVPNGAKEAFHLRLEQVNRFYFAKCQAVTIPDSSRWSRALITNGALIELGYKSVTLGATFVTDRHKNSGASKIDLDLGYEYNLTKTLKVHPFLGCELNDHGAGLTLGAKLNKDFDLFDYISLGVFAGCRYSQSKDVIYMGSNPFSYSNYISASVGAYWLLYNYQRPKIRRDW